MTYSIWGVLALVFFLGLLYFLVRPILRGAVFLPTPRGDLAEILALAGLRPGQKAADLGSGNGRVLIAFAENAVEAEGYEIDPLLVWLSRRAIRRADLAARARVQAQSFWSANLSGFDLVYVFGIHYIMKDLEEKLRRELRPGAQVITNTFHFSAWTPAETRGRLRRYIQS